MPGWPPTPPPPNHGSWLNIAVARFFTERIFGPGRAALQAAHMPASAADQAQRNADHAATLRKQLARIDTAETAPITELEIPADPADSAAQALRNRIRARFTDLYAQRTQLETQLAALAAPSPAELNDPTLLDELPTLADILTHAPEGLTERVLAAFDLQATYNPGKHQMTIHAVITDATPQAVADLLSDPRADHNRAPAQPASTQDQLGDLTGHTGSYLRNSTRRSTFGEVDRRSTSMLRPSN